MIVDYDCDEAVANIWTIYYTWD